MNINIIRKLYHKVPLRIRLRVRKIFKKENGYQKAYNKIIRYYSKIDKFDSEVCEVIRFLKDKKELQQYPYEFTYKYDLKKIKVYNDEISGLNFVYHKGKKLFFPREFNLHQIQNTYNTILMEQDEKSPHRYMNNKFKVDKDDIFIDIGAAEGLITLESIDLVEKAYLFECNDIWINALKETFKPWKDKVFIIDKFVCDKNSNNEVTLDYFLSDLKGNFFIKVDVEGSEANVLEGAKKVLGQNNIKIAICTYHNQNDADVFKSKFISLGYSVSLSKGYMIPMWKENDFYKPYLRKGVLLAQKLSSVMK